MISAMPSATGITAASPYPSARIAGSAERMSHSMYESSCTVTVAATVPKSVPSAVLANAARVRSPSGTIAVIV